ncbi:MAG TPA: hypothetical protein VM307_05075 [Egibacteraceae bacterium]|nr:hypothetical protein [Egibacteraceae bacterium]
MTTITRLLGATLIVVGIVAYVATGADSITALLPAFLGALILVLGVVAARPAAHRHAIHGALVLALLGLLGTLMNVAELPAVLAGRDVERPGAVVASSVTAVLCLVYLVLGVRSFIAARRNQDTAAA